MIRSGLEPEAPNEYDIPHWTFQVTHRAPLSSDSARLLQAHPVNQTSVGPLNKIERAELLTEILNGCRNGLYTKGEIESTALRLLADDRQYWVFFPEWLKSLLITRARDFSSEGAITTFGHADPEEIRKQMMEIKDWMSINGMF